MRAGPFAAGRATARGLYDPCFERDACGVGFVADLSGHPSHAMIEQGLKILREDRQVGVATLRVWLKVAMSQLRPARPSPRPRLAPVRLRPQSQRAGTRLDE
jgi:hypothetical protein